MEEKEVEADPEELKEAEEPAEGELPFANAEIVRLMKQTLSQGKMIKKSVKVAMNKFLAQILINVTQRMNKYPYATMEYPMFKEAVRPYEQIDQWTEEKTRIITYLEKIKADCDHLINEINRIA